MNRPMKTIEVDADTVASLEALARKKGITLSALLAGFAAGEDITSESLVAQVAELDRRVAAAAKSGAVPHDDVVRWLETWGTKSFRPWSGA